MNLIFALLATSLGSAIPKVGDTAPDFTLKTLAGTELTLSALHKQGPVVLVVLRGFPGYQCPICTTQVGDLVRNGEAFAARKTPVILIYPGPSQELQKHASEFVNGKNLPKNFYFVLDPDYSVVNRYGLRWNAPGETAYPSAFVVGRDGKIRFARVSQSHGGRVKASELLANLN